MCAHAAVRARVQGCARGCAVHAQHHVDVRSIHVHTWLCCMCACTCLLYCPRTVCMHVPVHAAVLRAHTTLPVRAERTRMWLCCICTHHIVCRHVHSAVPRVTVHVHPPRCSCTCLQACAFGCAVCAQRCVPVCTGMHVHARTLSYAVCLCACHTVHARVCMHVHMHVCICSCALCAHPTLCVHMLNAHAFGSAARACTVLRVPVHALGRAVCAQGGDFGVPGCYQGAGGQGGGGAHP